MNGRQAVKTALNSTQTILTMYLADFSDADLLVRPAEGANHPAWQLGHLVFAEGHLLRNNLPGVQYPELPASFAEQHSKDTATQEPPKGFLSKQQYLDLFQQARAATLAALDKLADADLDRPTSGSIAPFAPTLGDLLLLVANHTLMHAGQFTVVRRKLGKPVLI